VQLPPQRTSPEAHAQVPPLHVVGAAHKVQSVPPWPQAPFDVPFSHAPPEQQPEHDAESHAHAPDTQ